MYIYRNASHPINNDHDSNVMISPVSSISGKTNKSINPYSTVITNNQHMNLTTSPTLQSFSSSSSSGRFSLLFSQQEENHQHQKPVPPPQEQDLYYPPSHHLGNIPFYPTSPSSSSSLHQTQKSSFAPEWTSNLNTTTANSEDHIVSPPPVTDHESNQAHYWRRLGGIYA
ncbi:hypothetical protein BC941DRAFT_414335 [Chlamydoabsidia padenii]|nr:hypothetical protein BC941DRAFT_414335 [Chlamydoabsidia padenii]